MISLGIDTWGVDYGLLDRNDRLVGLPYHYRDSRNDTMMAEAFRRVPREEIFAATGIQFMQLNTLFQLLAQQIEDPEVLARTRTLLMMPDLLNYWLTGQKVSERTIASTSQALDPHRPAWATGLLERLGIPTHYLPPIVEAGTVLGGLLPGCDRRDRREAGVEWLRPAATTRPAPSRRCPPRAPTTPTSAPAPGR